MYCYVFLPKVNYVLSLFRCYFIIKFTDIDFVLSQLLLFSHNWILVISIVFVCDRERVHVSVSLCVCVCLFVCNSVTQSSWFID